MHTGCTFAAKNEKNKTIKNGRFHRVRHVQKPRCTTFHKILWRKIFRLLFSAAHRRVDKGILQGPATRDELEERLDNWMKTFEETGVITLLVKRAVAAAKSNIRKGCLDYLGTGTQPNEGLHRWMHKALWRGRQRIAVAHMLFTLYFHARNYKIGENVGQGLLYRTPEHAAAAGFQVPSECPNFGAWKHCACNNDNKDENGIVAVAPNEVVEHIEFDFGLENAENNEDVDVTNEEDDIEGTMQELNRWLQEAESIEDVDVYVDEHEGTGNDVQVLIENYDPLLDVDPLDAISEVIPLEDDQAVRVPSPEPVDSNSGSASPVVDVASLSNAPPGMQRSRAWCGT